MSGEASKKRKLSRGRLIVVSIMTLIVVAGIIVACWPLIYGAWLTYNYEEETSRFKEYILETQPDVVIRTLVTEEGEVDIYEPVKNQYPELLAAMKAYNQRIYAEKQEGLCDAWSYQNPSFDLEAYGIADGAIGIVSIPSLDIEMPLYIGATYQHLADGAAQLSQTSLPIGGINTNCVIAGHCGWSGADFFRYLSEIKIGAYVYVTNLWGTMTYQVTETKVIIPNDVDQILIQEGKDMVTLFTCHPYASGGLYRFVVYCERVEEPEAISVPAE